MTPLVKLALKAVAVALAKVFLDHATKSANKPQPPPRT